MSCNCNCSSYCRSVRKRAKNTHVAGANCCSSFKNVYSKRKRCCGDWDDDDEIFIDD
jgi:hypothetical protein